MGVQAWVWRVKYSLAKIRSAARTLLTLEEKDHRRLFEGNALLRRLVRIGVLDEGHMKLDYVLGLKIEDFLERRLQTQVFKLGLAKSIHHARVLITEAHPCEEAGGQRALFHRPSGLPEAHRLQPQVTIRRRSSRPRQEEERQEGIRRRRRGGRGLRTIQLPSADIRSSSLISISAAADHTNNPYFSVEEHKQALPSLLALESVNADTKIKTTKNCR